MHPSLSKITNINTFLYLLWYLSNKINKILPIKLQFIPLLTKFIPLPTLFLYLPQSIYYHKHYVYIYFTIFQSSYFCSILR